MTIRRNRDGCVVVDCNGNGCTASFDTDMKDFGLALELARDEGFKSVKVRGKWEHLCADCADDD